MDTFVYAAGHLGHPGVQTAHASTDLKLGALRNIIPALEQRLAVYQVVDEPPDAETREVFTSYLDESLVALDLAMKLGDMASIARRGHALKGMGGAVGAPEISVLGEQLEKTADDGNREYAGRLVMGLLEWRDAGGLRGG